MGDVDAVLQGQLAVLTRHGDHVVAVGTDDLALVLGVARQRHVTAVFHLDGFCRETAAVDVVAVQVDGNVAVFRVNSDTLSGCRGLAIHIFRAHYVLVELDVAVGGFIAVSIFARGVPGFDAPPAGAILQGIAPAVAVAVRSILMFELGAVGVFIHRRFADIFGWLGGVARIGRCGLSGRLCDNAVDRVLEVIKGGRQGADVYHSQAHEQCQEKA